MTAFNKYSFSLCLIVFVLLVGFFSVLIGMIVRATEKLIACGDQDDAIIDEFLKKNNGKTKRAKGGYALNLLVSLLFLAVFAFAIFVNVQENAFSKNVPTPRVVQSASMSAKHETNGYLTENNLNDQIQMYDIVLTYKLPDEMELELYDIVVYEVDGQQVIHRIIEIEEPNEQHPDHRYFRMQGDNVDRPDVFPVRYEQMRGIYTGKRVPYVGSLIMFLQGLPGWLCMSLLLFAMLVTPLLDKRLEKRRAKRYVELCAVRANEAPLYYPEAVYDPYWYGGYY